MLHRPNTQHGDIRLSRISVFTVYSNIQSSGQLICNIVPFTKPDIALTPLSLTCCDNGGIVSKI